MTDYTQALRSLMTQAGIPSFRVLTQRANVSSWQLRQLRQGHAIQMRLAPLLAISKALNISVAILIEQCSNVTLSTKTQSGEQEQTTPVDRQYEYQRLQDQLESQKQSLHHDFQRTSLQTLESWMTYWPAAVYATQSQPDLPATRLIPLVRPVEQLLAQWGVEAIATVATEVPYDPKKHQLIEGQADPGDVVRISYPGYMHNGALLQRAKVKPLN